MKKTMKRTMAYILVLVLTLTLAPAALAASGAWDGNSYSTSWYDADPTAEEFYISTAEDLAGFAKLVNDETEDFTDKTIYLEADIDLGSYEWTPIGWYISGSVYSVFCGTFDGQGYEVSNLLISNTSLSFIGLFGLSDGTIKNLSVEGLIEYASILGGGYAGGIAGYNFGTIENCENYVRVINTYASNKFVGGITGVNDGTIEGCTNYATVKNMYSTGGIAGLNTDTITKCVNEGEIVHATNSNTYAGGIAGYTDGGTISLCINRGDVSSTSTGGTPYLGGITGVLDTDSPSYVLNCLNTGSVTCSVAGHLGGIAGTAYNGEIKNCLNTGIVVSANTAQYPDGAITSEASSSIAVTISNSYYLESTCGVAIGKQQTATVTNVESKTDVQLQADEILALLNEGQDPAVWCFGASGHLEEGYPTLLFAVPAITTQPQNKTVTAGSTATFTVSVESGSGGYTYQWQVSTDGGSAWDEIPGATESSYTTDATTTAMSGYMYRSVVTDGNGASVTSDVATLTVNNAPSSGGFTYYTVKFDSNGGSAISDKSVTSGSTVTKPADPTREGYTFTGWYTDEDCTALYDFSAKVTKAFALYAGWDEAEPDEWHNPFIDVQEGNWFYDDVRYVYENGLMVGTSAAAFSPSLDVTRGMVVTVLWRIEGEPATNEENPFTDLTQDWYKEAVIWAAANGIVEGYGDGIFGPEDSITREQLATMLYRYAGWAGLDVSADTDISSFVDSSNVAMYAADAMRWACGAGIITGKPGNLLDPQGTATRAETAAMLHRMLGAVLSE